MECFCVVVFVCVWVGSGGFAIVRIVDYFDSMYVAEEVVAGGYVW